MNRSAERNLQSMETNELTANPNHKFWQKTGPIE
jgi:hypothetical protein